MYRNLIVVLVLVSLMLVSGVSAQTQIPDSVKKSYAKFYKSVKTPKSLYEQGLAAWAKGDTVDARGFAEASKLYVEMNGPTISTLKKRVSNVEKYGMIFAEIDSVHGRVDDLIEDTEAEFEAMEKKLEAIDEGFQFLEENAKFKGNDKKAAKRLGRIIRDM